MVKVLRKINRGLARLEEREGQVSTFAQFVNRVCRVLRVKAAVIDDGGSGYGPQYLPLGEATDRLNRELVNALAESWPAEWAAANERKAA